MNASSRISVIAMVALMILAALVIMPVASGGKMVKGNITDTHWTMAMSPIYVENNITIGEGKALLIDAGVQVLVNGSYTIYVNGTLTAQGNAASPILFASNKTVKTAGDWKGIRFNATANALFESVNVSHAKTPIFIGNCTNVTLINSTFYKTQSLDVNVTGDGELTLVNTTCNSMNTTGGILHLADFLTMKAVFQFNNTPIQGIDVLITDNNYPIYTTPRYGGTDLLTNESGLVGPIVARYATYDHSNVSQMNVTKIYTKYNHSSGIKNVKNESIIVSDATQVVLVYDITPPGPVTNFTAKVRSGVRIDLAWLGPADADLNLFYLYQKFGMGYSLMQITKNHYYNFTNLNPKTRYDFAIRAVDNYDNPSAQVLANGTTVDTVAPAKPVNLTVSAVTGTTVSLEWDANAESDLAGYYIYVNATVGWKPKMTVGNATLAYTVTNLTSETTYTFTIEAFDDALPLPNNSTKSAMVYATTLDITAPQTPSNIILPPTAIISTLAIRGQIKGDTEVLKVVIHNDRNGYHNTTNSTGGIINTTIPLEQGNNVIMIYAVDGAGNIGGNVTGTVYCDSLAPEAACQGNIAIYTGETAYFNATASSDNLGIVNYVWSFTYNNATETVNGAMANFTFAHPYHYLVTLTVGDLLGNEAIVTFWVNVTDKVVPVVDVTAPSIVSRIPAVDGYNITRDVTITVTFNEALDPLNWTIVLKQGSDIISGDKNLTNGHKTLTFKPQSNLGYNTTYTVNVTAVDPAGNKMYSQWTFVTVENPNQPVTPIDDGNKTKDDNFQFYATITILAVIIVLFLVVIIIVVRKAMTEKDLITDETKAEEDEDKIEYACPKCSAPLSEGITYCYECGAEFTEDEAKSAGEKVTDEDEEEEEKEEGEDEEGEEEAEGSEAEEEEKAEADEEEEAEEAEEADAKDEDSRDESHTHDEDEDSEDADDAESDEDSEDDVEEVDEEETEDKEAEEEEK